MSQLCFTTAENNLSLLKNKQ